MEDVNILYLYPSYNMVYIYGYATTKKARTGKRDRGQIRKKSAKRRWMKPYFD